MGYVHVHVCMGYVHVHVCMGYAHAHVCMGYGNSQSFRTVRKVHVYIISINYAVTLL